MCGAVHFRAVDMSDEFSTCFCTACQRWTGSSFQGASVKSENLTVNGQENVGVVKSSGFAERAFCKNCGSSLWFRLTAGKYIGNTSVALGMLDDASGMTLTREYFVDKKPTHQVQPGGCKQITSAEAENIIADFMAEDQQ